MKCLFLSDAHFPKSKAILSFLLDVYTEFDAIYILGDLFEFYYGYENFFYSHHAELFGVLNVISKKTEVFLFEGNHEYNLYAIKRFLDVNVIKKELEIEIDGMNVYMEHGDRIDKNDIYYRLFRLALKNPFSLKLIGKIDYRFLFDMSKKASHFSKKRLKDKTDRRTDVALEAFAEQLTKNGKDVVILAHTHTPLLKKMDSGLYINCGDFFEHFSYVVYDSKNGFSLKFYKG